MREIPYGETATYGGMAMALGSGPRPIGMACGRNPIPIIVPCHRVLASGGKEGGFSGGRGLPTKRNCWRWKAWCFFREMLSSSSSSPPPGGEAG